jgi:hypothetical protein
MTEYNPETGLLDRIWNLFPRGNGIKVPKDKLLVIEVMLWAILILAATRVFDAISVVYATLDPVSRFLISFVTLALTEGGFVAWRAFRYHPETNKTQRDTALFGMATSFIASIAIGISEYLARALDGLTINGQLIATHEIMVWTVGAAYTVAILGHVIAALAAKEFDDDVSATHQRNVIAQSVKTTRSGAEHARLRAVAEAEALVGKAEMAAGVMATLAVAPVAAVLGAVAKTRTNIVEAYGTHIDSGQVNELLAAISADLPAAIRETYSGSVKRFLLNEKTAADLGLNPEQVEAAIERATAGMEVSLRTSLSGKPAKTTAELPEAHLAAPADPAQGPVREKVANLTPPPLFIPGDNGNGHIPPR